MALPHDPLIKRLEDERQKYYSETHQPTTSQLNRFGAGCQLLKEDPQVLRQNKSSTRQRKSTAQYNLSKIARLSSSVFTLICFVIGFTELGSKSHLELNPKLRSWWENAARPKRLLKLVQEICDEEGIEYVETIQSPEERQDQSNPMEGPMLLHRDKTLMLQISLLPSEPPYQEFNFSIQELIHFLQTRNDLTNVPATVNLLQQYEPSFPSLKMKLPLYGAFPSVEIKVTSDLGSSAVLLFAWELAIDLVYSLGTSTANIAN